MSRLICNTKTPAGVLTITSGGGYITGVSFGAPASTEADEPDELVRLCAFELEQYFKGKLKHFTVPVKTTGTPFQTRVWEQLTRIPYGETVSYKQLAERAGNARAVRAVGGANHRNPVVIIIPCHRVIGANGSLTGFGGGLAAKEFLLNLEKSAIFQ